MAEKSGGNLGAVSNTQSSSDNGGFSFALHGFTWHVATKKKKTTWKIVIFFSNPMHATGSPRTLFVFGLLMKKFLVQESTSKLLSFW